MSERRSQQCCAHCYAQLARRRHGAILCDGCESDWQQRFAAFLWRRAGAPAPPAPPHR